MFTISRILNAGANLPETVRLPVTAETSYKAGCALKIASGKATHCGATDKPTYLCAEDVAADAKKTVTAYVLTPDVILEAPVSASVADLSVGTAVTLNVNSAGMAIGVTATATNGVATIYDLCGATVAGDRVLVRIV